VLNCVVVETKPWADVAEVAAVVAVVPDEELELGAAGFELDDEAFGLELDASRLELELELDTYDEQGRELEDELLELELETGTLHWQESPSMVNSSTAKPSSVAAMNAASSGLV